MPLSCLDVILEFLEACDNMIDSTADTIPVPVGLLWLTGATACGDKSTVSSPGIDTNDSYRLLVWTS